MKQEQMCYKRKIPAAVLVAACMIILCSSTVLAVYKYLSPAEVVTEINDNALQKAFLSEDAILVNETQESGGYKVTLMGSVAGKNISDFLLKPEAGRYMRTEFTQLSRLSALMARRCRTQTLMNMGKCVSLPLII